MKSRIPAGRYLYSGIAVVSSVLAAAGLHRAVYAALRSIGVPSLGISAFAGLTGLSWYELAYAVGGGLKMVRVYDVLPFLGCTTGVLSGILLLTRFRFRRYALYAHLGLSLLLSVLGLSVLLWRLSRGIADLWRIVAVFAFLAATAAWVAYFRRSPVDSGLPRKQGEARLPGD